jgi:acyl carrier protein
MSEKLAEKLRTFIWKRFPAVRASALSDDASLLDAGVIDSLGVLDLAQFIAEELRIELGDEDLTPENFKSISALTRLLSRKGS